MYYYLCLYAVWKIDKDTLYDAFSKIIEGAVWMFIND